MHKFKRYSGKYPCRVYSNKSVVFSQLLLTVQPSVPKLKYVS